METVVSKELQFLGHIMTSMDTIMTPSLYLPCFVVSIRESRERKKRVLEPKNATKGAVTSILCTRRHLEDLGEDGDHEVRCHGLVKVPLCILIYAMCRI